MNRRFACLIAAAVALAAGAPALTCAMPDRLPDGDVELIVDGAPQHRYAHQGRWYVEALKGREYAIRIRNPYGVRVAVALSVDGLNTIDARQTSAADARKWVIDPYGTITISGWQTSMNDARRFVFTTEAGSYGQALGRTENLGVIAAVFFRERVPVYTARDRAEPPAAPMAGAKGAARGQMQEKPQDKDEYAATGIGRRTDHAVTSVWLDLEDAPARTVNVRYEFRPQLVALGILPPAHTASPLERRERARGFEPGFCPEPPRQR